MSTSDERNWLILVFATLIALSLSYPCVSFGEGKFPVPSDQAQKDASQIVQEVYGRELEQARTPAQRSSIAADMLTTAYESQPGSAEQHALLRAAIEQATVAYDVERVRQAIGRLVLVFDANEITLSAGAIEAMVASTPPTAACEPIRDFVDTTLHEALRSEDFERAATLSNINIELSRRLRSASAIKRAMEMPAMIEAVKATYERAKDAQVTLFTNPGDKAACDAMGSYLCFGKNDWEQGISYLLSGSDASLRQLAEMELSPEPNPGRLADEWWKFAEGAEPWIQKSSRKRAAYWYQIAYPSLVGLPRKLAEQRLEEVKTIYGAVPVKPLGFVQGEWTTLFPSDKFASKWINALSSKGKVDFKSPVLRLSSNPNAHTICEYPVNLQDLVVRVQVEIHARDNAFVELRKGLHRGCSFIANRSGTWSIGSISEKGYFPRIQSGTAQSARPRQGTFQLQAASLGDRQILWINGRKTAETTITQIRTTGNIGIGVYNSGDASFSKIEVLWPTDEQVLKLLTGSP